MTSTEAWAQAEAQGTLQPGEQGWWKVWGARAANVQPGDLLLLAGQEPTLIADTFTAKAAPMRIGLVSAEGERFTIGALADVIVLRPGTHNTLA
jgi:hypothetical protein